MAKKIIVNENQLAVLLEELAGSEILRDQDKMATPIRYPIDPHKVLIVKDFLDKNFQRRTKDILDNNGFPGDQRFVCVVRNGNDLQPMFNEDAIELLFDWCKDMFLKQDERRRFVTQVFNDWYNDKISPYGLLSKNYV